MSHPVHSVGIQKAHQLALMEPITSRQATLPPKVLSVHHDGPPSKEFLERRRETE